MTIYMADITVRGPRLCISEEKSIVIVRFTQSTEKSKPPKSKCDRLSLECEMICHSPGEVQDEVRRQSQEAVHLPCMCASYYGIGPGLSIKLLQNLRTT